MSYHTKENFCPACLAAIPLAFGGLGSGIKAATLSEEEKKKNKQKTIIWIIISVLSLYLAYYFYKRSKSGMCNTFSGSQKTCTPK